MTYYLISKNNGKMVYGERPMIPTPAELNEITNTLMELMKKVQEAKEREKGLSRKV